VDFHEIQQAGHAAESNRDVTILIPYLQPLKNGGF
jgi:hypothetical protein